VDIQRQQPARCQAVQIADYHRYDVIDDGQGRSEGRWQLQGHTRERKWTGVVHGQTHCARYTHCAVLRYKSELKLFLQRVSIASYAKRCISYDRFCPTV